MQSDCINIQQQPKSTTTKTISDMAKKTKTLLNMNDNDTRFLIAMYFLNGNKTEAYRFIQGNSITENEPSIRAAASMYSKKTTVKQLEAIVKAQYIESATKLMEAEGYKVLKPKEASEYILQQFEKNEQAEKQSNESKDIEVNATGAKGWEPVYDGNDKNDGNSGGNDRNRANDGDNSGNSSKGITLDKNLSNFSDTNEIDLSNKDAMLAELNYRYGLATNERDRSEIRKQIIDVQNMKRQEQVEDGKLRKVMYLPLRQCSNCPNLHVLASENANILPPKK